MYSFIYSICIHLFMYVFIIFQLPLLPHLQAAESALRPRAISQAHYRYDGGKKIYKYIDRDIDICIDLDTDIDIYKCV